MDDHLTLYVTLPGHRGMSCEFARFARYSSCADQAETFVQLVAELVLRFEEETGLCIDAHEVAQAIRRRRL